jgi:hypothetical protein
MFWIRQFAKNMISWPFRLIWQPARAVALSACYGCAALSRLLRNSFVYGKRRLYGIPRLRPQTTKELALYVIGREGHGYRRQGSGARYGAADDKCGASAMAGGGLGHAAMILAPSHFMRVLGKIVARDMMMNPDFGATDVREE